MIEVRLCGVHKLIYKNVESPKAKNDQAVIKVMSSGICGSDVWYYSVKERLKKCVTRGHEFGGIIKSLKQKNTKYKIGMKVVVNPAIPCGQCYYCHNSVENLCENLKYIGRDISGSMKEEITVPIDNLVKLNDSFDLIYAPLVEPTAVAIHAANNIKNSNVLIIGVSTIGLLIQQICKINNNKIIALDIEDNSLKLSKNLSSDFILNFNDKSKIERINKFLGNTKVDVIFDNVCSEDTLSFAIKTIKKGGEIYMVGIMHKNFELDIRNILYKEIILKTSFAYTSLNFKKAIYYVVNKKLNTKILISRIFPLNKAKEAFEYKLKNPSGKVILVNNEYINN